MKTSMHYRKNYVFLLYDYHAPPQKIKWVKKAVERRTVNWDISTQYGTTTSFFNMLYVL